MIRVGDMVKASYHPGAKGVVTQILCEGWVFVKYTTNTTLWWVPLDNKFCRHHINYLIKIGSDKIVCS